MYKMKYKSRKTPTLSLRAIDSMSEPEDIIMKEAAHMKKYSIRVSIQYTNVI